MKPKQKPLTIKLQCPLCCEDAFGSYESLHEHLLSITENLFCTACNTRFEDVAKLIDHIGNRCQDPEEEPAPKVLQVEKHAEIDPSNQSLLDLLEGNDVDVDTGPTQPIVTAKTEPPIVPDEYEEEEAEELYHCSECNVNFADIDEHLKQFHQGQKVLLEDGEQSTERTISPPPLALLSPKPSNPSPLTSPTGSTPPSASTVAKNAPKMTKEYVIRNGKPVPLRDGEKIVAADTNDLIVMHQCSVCRVHFISQEEFNVHICRLQPNYGENSDMKDTSEDQEKSPVKSKKTKKRRLDNDENKSIPPLPKHDIQCTECTSVFTNHKDLKLHLKVHRELDKMQLEKEGPHVCLICNTEFTSIKSLRLHSRMHDPIKQKEIEPPVNYGITGEINYAIASSERNTFRCEVCGNDYDEEYHDVHMRSHAEAAAGEDSVHHCDVCNKRFASQQYLDMHMAAHMDAKRFVCTYCKKAFLTIALLNAHTTDECNVRPYECRFCGRRFARPHEKVKHERIHTGEKPHVCGVCGKAFRVGYCLTLHMRTHSGSRPYQCPHCLKRFKAHSVYTHHIHTHSNERKYKCPFCPKAFKTSVQLAGHKNCHTKPFNCNICNRPFASLYAVKLHMDTHKKANNLNHNCQYCGASYARAFALRDHIRDLHSEEDDLTAPILQDNNNSADDDQLTDNVSMTMEAKAEDLIGAEEDEEEEEFIEEGEDDPEEQEEMVEMEEANEEELTYLNEMEDGKMLNVMIGSDGGVVVAQEIVEDREEEVLCN